MVLQCLRGSGLSRCCPAAEHDLSGMCAEYHTGSPSGDVNKTLGALGVGAVDLLLLHWPCATPEETARVYRELTRTLETGQAPTARACPVSIVDATTTRIFHLVIYNVARQGKL